MDKKTLIEKAGNASKLARDLGISRAAISSWKDSPPLLRIYQLKELHPEWFDDVKVSASVTDANTLNV